MKLLKQYSLHFIVAICILWCTFLSYHQFFINQRVGFITDFVRISKVDQKSKFIEILGKPMYIYTAGKTISEKGPIKNADYINRERTLFFCLCKEHSI